MRINRLDHLVLTVADIDVTVRFYAEVLGMEMEIFDEGRTALRFGSSKINLHLAGHEFEPKAHVALPGTADLCLIVDDPIDTVIAELDAHEVEIIKGPVRRTGATGTIRSVYFRDPDLNLVELSNYL